MRLIVFAVVGVLVLPSVTRAQSHAGAPQKDHETAPQKAAAADPKHPAPVPAAMAAKPVVSRFVTRRQPPRATPPPAPRYVLVWPELDQRWHVAWPTASTRIALVWPKIEP